MTEKHSFNALIGVVVLCSWASRAVNRIWRRQWYFESRRLWGPKAPTQARGLGVADAQSKMTLIFDIAKNWLSLPILNKFWSGWLIKNSRHPPPPRKFWNLESCKCHFQHFQEVFPGADFMKGGSDKWPPKVVAPRRVWSGGMLPQKIVKFRVSELRFPAFSGAIWSGLAELVHFF